MRTSQDINIITASGVRLDTFTEETIEVVGGGVSLLDLGRRSDNFTSEFDMPRTPTNEIQFAFASQLSRTNKVAIPAYLQSGLFQKKGLLTVNSFTDRYSVSFSFSDFISAMAGVKLNDVLDDIANPILTNTTSVESAFTALLASEDFTLFRTFGAVTEGFVEMNNQGIWINCKRLIEEICLKVGYTAVFIGDVGMADGFFYCRDWEYRVSASGNYNLHIYRNANNHIKGVSTILKDICQLFMLDFNVDGISKTVTFFSVEYILTQSAVSVETLLMTEKQISAVTNLSNNIKYTVGDGIVSTYQIGTFTGDGVSSSELLVLESYIPALSEGLRDYTDFSGTSIAKRTTLATTGEVFNLYTTAGGVIIGGLALSTLTYFDLDTFYGFLSNVFTTPTVISASGYLTQIQATEVMQNRLISSVQLNGKYYVETFNYNINTGKTVVKLIKI